eukprot:CAMPEP_0175124324 /NCGR_PEP_ID=MMETSP0087-20121206/2720_1 /TAXON_ID=136419 /ORGANISM="Unknown Unknown, Strain D1" /LENGTH=277 /DNA_ID=CAMNT_0016406083 /DNA_START=434 /DNA_END=1267 /DNA_ORIENTATION=-
MVLLLVCFNVFFFRVRFLLRSRKQATTPKAPPTDPKRNQRNQFDWGKTQTSFALSSPPKDSSKEVNTKFGSNNSQSQLMKKPLQHMARFQCFVTITIILAIVLVAAGSKISSSEAPYYGVCLEAAAEWQNKTDASASSPMDGCDVTAPLVFLCLHVAALAIFCWHSWLPLSLGTKDEAKKGTDQAPQGWVVQRLAEKKPHISSPARTSFKRALPGHSAFESTPVVPLLTAIDNAGSAPLERQLSISLRMDSLVDNSTERRAVPGMAHSEDERDVDAT